MKRFILHLMLLLMAATAAFGQSDTTENQRMMAKAKAFLALNFIRYCGFPEEMRQGDFVIAVVGDKEIYAWLKKLSNGKKLGFQDIVVKNFKRVRTKRLKKCQMVYMTQNSRPKKRAKRALKKIGESSLVITETKGATECGSMINFVVRNDRINFELCERNTKKAGVCFSSKLKQLNGAINVE